MERFLKKLDFLGSPLLKSVVLAAVVLLCIGVTGGLFLLLSLAIDVWALFVLGGLFYVALVVICFLGFRERERRRDA